MLEIAAYYSWATATLTSDLSRIKLVYREYLLYHRPNADTVSLRYCVLLRTIAALSAFITEITE